MFIVKSAVILILQAKNTVFNTARTISKLEFAIGEIKVVSLVIIKYTRELVIIIIAKLSKLLYWICIVSKSKEFLLLVVINLAKL